MLKKVLLGLLLIIGFVFLSPISVLSAQTTVSSVPHWQSGNITVYIPANEPKTDTMKHAFQKWSKLSFGNLNFNFVSKEKAQITVTFTDKVSGDDGPIGICNLSIQGPYITKAEIQIAVNSKQQYSNDMIYTTMLHEIGHALGLNDTTRKYRSIMHMPITADQDVLSIDMEKLFKVNNWSWSQKKVNLK